MNWSLSHSKSFPIAVQHRLLQSKLRSQNLLYLSYVPTNLVILTTLSISSQIQYFLCFISYNWSIGWLFFDKGYIPTKKWSIFALQAYLELNILWVLKKNLGVHGWALYRQLWPFPLIHKEGFPGSMIWHYWPKWWKIYNEKQRIVKFSILKIIGFDISEFKFMAWYSDFDRLANLKIEDESWFHIG